jgi:hypothetical protein
VCVETANDAVGVCVCVFFFKHTKRLAAIQLMNVDVDVHTSIPICTGKDEKG